MYPTIHIVLPSYTVLAAVGGMVTMLFLYFRIGKYGFAFSDFLKMFILSVILGAVGSRVMYILSHVPDLILNFSLEHLLSTVFSGGFVFYGGLFGVLFGVYIYAKRRGYEIEKIFNMIAPAIPLFHSIGRIGCFMAGCCYGFKLPTGISIFGLTVTHFPTQLVEALFEFLLFITLWFIQKKARNANYLKIYLISYAVFRFMIEFLRADAIRGVFGGISTSQFISIGILVYFCISSILKKRKRADQL